MKNVLITGILLLWAFWATPAAGQQKLQSQPCDQNFSPIYLHDHLPAQAIYTDTTAAAAARARDVLKRLTFSEKLRLTGGWNYMYFPAIPRLGLRPVFFKDASQGLRISNYGMKERCISIDKSTAFPCELALAATWNPQLAFQYARCIGEECRAWGVDVLLGPGLNLYRNTEGGRNFEYMGEDPFLTSAMAVPYIKGLQSTGTLATPKHFIGNEQEFARHIVNVEIGNRALHELYLPPFLSAIRAGGALAIMTGNNRVNGYPGAANRPLSANVLRKAYGYQGIIMSDWANSTFWPEQQKEIIGSGQSLLMSNNALFAQFVQKEITAHPAKKQAIEKALDTMVFHNLYAFFKMGVYDRPYRDPALVQQIARHQDIALQTAEEAITLLKNEDHILPIDPDQGKTIVVLGTDAALAAYAGTGSGRVAGYHRVDYLSGLKNVYGDKIIREKNVSDQAIRAADIVLYFINKKCGEGYDVPFDLPDINAKVAQCARLNKNLVVVYSGGNGLAMPWLAAVKGVLYAYLLGQESGTALANIISGKTNPSGKLPFTMEKRFSDSPAYGYNKMKDGHYYWQGHGGSDRTYRKKFGEITMSYDEGVYIGYRWYEKKHIQPQFPFGFGLSYTSFKISGMTASAATLQKDRPVEIQLQITNTGTKAGAEVVQLYVHKMNPAIDRPVKALKGFKKVFLQPGESKTIRLPIQAQDLAFWSGKEKRWKVSPGTYQLEAGTSAQHIVQRIRIHKH